MNHQPNRYGLDPKREITDRSTPFVDHRTSQQIIADGLRSKELTGFLMIAAAGFSLLEPPVTGLMPWFGILYLLIHMIATASRRGDDPTMLPARWPVHDRDKREYKRFGRPVDGLNKPSGIFLLGQELTTGREIWMSNSDIREHIWVNGTTGSGKTETLMGVMVNAMSWGSGFVMIDGKGDIATAAKVNRIARIMGRTDDFMLLNFMVSSRRGAGGGLIGHTMNPFAVYSQPEIMQTMESILPKASGDSGPWQARAVAMLSAVTTVLVWLRDSKGMNLSIAHIRASIDLDSITRMAVPDDYVVPLYKGMPPDVKNGVRYYLQNLSGFPQELLSVPQAGQPEHPLARDPNAYLKFPDGCRTQHGYLTQLLSQPFNLLAESYRSVFGVASGDVNMFDVVLNRRLLLVLIPAMQKSTEEAANLGKIVVATLKTMMGETLGSQFEGSVKRILLDRQTNSLTPFMVLLDELTYYIVKGLSVFPAQGRALGFSFLFAVQSLTGLYEIDRAEGSTSYNTTNTKITMFSVDQKGSIESAVTDAGKGFVAKQSGVESDTSSPLIGARNPAQQAGFEERNRYEAQDILAQGQGQFVMQHHDVVLQGGSLYIANDSVMRKSDAYDFDAHSALRMTHFVAIPPESEEDIRARKAFNLFVSVLEGGPPPYEQMASDIRRDELSVYSGTINALQEQSQDPALPPLEQAAIGFARLGKTLEQAANLMGLDRSGGQVMGMPGGGGGLPDFMTAGGDTGGRPKRQPRGFAPQTPRPAARFTDQQAPTPLDLDSTGAISDRTLQALDDLDHAGAAGRDTDREIMDAISNSDTRPQGPRFTRPRPPAGKDPHEGDHDDTDVDADTLLGGKTGDDKAGSDKTGSDKATADPLAAASGDKAKATAGDKTSGDGRKDSGKTETKGDAGKTEGGAAAKPAAAKPAPTANSVAEYLGRVIGNTGGLSLDQDAGKARDDKD